MIKARGIIFIVASLAVAFFAATMVSRYLKKPVSSEVRLVVAGADISPGDRLTPEKLKTIRWPESDVPRGSFSSVRKVAGRVAAGSIHEGEPINEKRLVPQGEFAESYLATRIGPGMRAVSMEIDRVSGVSGMLSPGDRVDVIATNPLQGSKGARISRVILSGVKVLAVSYEGKNGKKEKTFRKGIVTLLLSREDALTLAASEGARLRLVKRNPSDGSEGEYETTVFSASLGPKKASELQKMAAERDRRLQEAIKKGMRAVTIRVRDEDGICGFLRPGNRVDVIATHPFIEAAVHGRPVPGAEATVTNNLLASKILMQDVEVLFIEEDVEITEEARPKSAPDTSKDGKTAQGEKNTSAEWVAPWPTKRVTLLVSPEDAERLAVIAATSADVKLIVRKHGDNEIVETKGEKSNEIFFKEKGLYYDIEILGRGTSRGTKRFDRKKLEEDDKNPGHEPWESEKDNEI